MLDIPLYERSIQHALKLREYFEVNIWLSTDIQEILENKKYHGKINICERRKELAGDNVLTFDVIKDLLNKNNIHREDLILLLQPTSPFRNIEEIRESIISLLSEKKWQSVVSLSEVKSNHPFRMKRLTYENECIDFIDQGFEDMRPRQNLTKVFIRSGNFYIAYVESFLEQNTLLPKPTKGIIHNDPINAINIDNLNDLYLAEIIGKS